MKLFIFFFSIYVINTFAADGKIYFLKGDLLVNNKKATINQEVHYGDQLRTGKKSLVVVQLRPATIIKIKENSSLIIEKIEQQADIKSHSYVLKFGEIFIKATQTKDHHYQVKTKSVAMGVRGTQFFVAEGATTWMCVNDGQVEVKMRNGQKETVLVHAGEGVKIDSPNLPEVKKYEWTKKLNWQMSGDFDQLNDTTKIENVNYDIQNFDYD